eukprot:1167650-Rhodomonas_salina.1
MDRNLGLAPLLHSDSCDGERKTAIVLKSGEEDVADHLGAAQGLHGGHIFLRELPDEVHGKVPQGEVV